MKSLTESIVSEAAGAQWNVFKSLSIPVTVSKFAAPEKPYLWIYAENHCMSFLTLNEIEDNFIDNDMEDEFKEIKALKVGESWCEDGLNIYIRLY